MNKMKKEKLTTYYVEGPDWEHTVSIDHEIFESEAEQLFEAATRAMETQLATAKTFNVGAVILVRKSKTAKKEAMVNAYICLCNMGNYKLAENLRTNFKKETGQDLATDEIGYSF
jgi:hypothetical protein